MNLLPCIHTPPRRKEGPEMVLQPPLFYNFTHKKLFKKKLKTQFEFFHNLKVNFKLVLTEGLHRGVCDVCMLMQLPSSYRHQKTFEFHKFKIYKLNTFLLFTFEKTNELSCKRWLLQRSSLSVAVDAIRWFPKLKSCHYVLIRTFFPTHQFFKFFRLALTF